MKRLFAGLLVCCFLLIGQSADAVELLIIEQKGCHWCAHWNEEVGNAYHLTDEGKIAPLRRIDIGAGWPDELAHIKRERLTPSFILLQDGEEVGRLRGYPGDHFFWPLLQDLLAKLDSSSTPK